MENLLSNIQKIFSPEIIAGTSGIIGTVVGALIATRASRSQETRRFLAESYSELFYAYAQWVVSNDSKTFANLISASERTRLLCSSKANHLIEQLENEITANNPDTEFCGQLIGKIRHYAKQDVSK